jgi:hypothetical protein
MLVIASPIKPCKSSPKNSRSTTVTHQREQKSVMAPARATMQTANSIIRAIVTNTHICMQVTIFMKRPTPVLMGFTRWVVIEELHTTRITFRFGMEDSGMSSAIAIVKMALGAIIVNRQSCFVRRKIKKCTGSHSCLKFLRSH